MYRVSVFFLNQPDAAPGCVGLVVVVPRGVVTIIR